MAGILEVHSTGGSSNSGNTNSGSATTTTYTVQSGDSVWGISFIWYHNGSVDPMEQYQKQFHLSRTKIDNQR